MAKREPAQRPRCDHPVANWCTVKTDHLLICRQCSDTVRTRIAGEPVPSGVLFKGPQGVYGPFNPRGW